MTLSEFFYLDVDTGMEESVCALKFSRRKNGDLRCRLVLDAELSEMLRDMGTMVSVEVNKRGDIMLTPSPTGLTVSSDRKAFISLDKHAKKLYAVNGDDAEYRRLVMHGGGKFMLSPLSIQHKHR